MGQPPEVQTDRRFGNPHISLDIPPMKTSPASPAASLPAGVGYLTFLGFFQVGVGALSVLFSLFAIVQGTLIDPQLFKPEAVTDSSRGLFGQLLIAYIGFQMLAGWLLGGWMILAGVRCLQRRGRTIVTLSTWLNFINVPHGTMAAILAFIGLSRPEVVAAFERPPQE